MSIRPCRTRSVPPVLLAAALTAALTGALAASRATAPPAAAQDAPPPQSTLPMKVTQGTELSEKEEKEVRASLSGYLQALKQRDFEKAAGFVDRASFLEQGEKMVTDLATEPEFRDGIRKSIFGVATREEMAKRPTGELFRSLMDYLEAANPGATGLLTNADLKLLVARKFQDKVHIAYEITVPAEEEGGTPLTHVTAEQLRKSDGKWRILFRLGE